MKKFNIQRTVDLQEEVAAAALRQHDVYKQPGDPDYRLTQYDIYNDLQAVARLLGKIRARMIEGQEL